MQTGTTPVVIGVDDGLAAANAVSRRAFAGRELRVGQMLSLDHVVVQSGSAVVAEIGGEVVALDASSGTCYGMNTVASRVWALIATPRKVGEICATLLDEFVVDAATCERQVLDLLEDLRREGLLIVAEAISADSRVAAPPEAIP